MISAAIVPCSGYYVMYLRTLLLPWRCQWLLIEFLVGALSVHPVACVMAAFWGILSIQMG